MGLMRLPEVVVLELTYRCNHKCIFCSCPWENDEGYKADELCFEEWMDVIDTLLEYGVQSFTISGGEPLLREDLKDIIDYILDKKKSVNMISNGRRIDDEFLDYLASRGVSICISIPGIESFERQTGVDNVDHVLGLFEKAHRRNINVTANIAVTKNNLNELYENIAYPLIRGADYILLNRFLPGGRGLKNTDFLLSKEEVNNMLDVAEEVLEKAKRYGHIGTELPLCVIDNIDKYKRISVSTLCSAAKEFCVIDPSGYMKVCNHSPKRLCKYTEISELFKNDYWAMFQKSKYLPEMCKACDKRDVCDGGCREAANVYYGDVCDNDPIFES